MAEEIGCALAEFLKQIARFDIEAQLFSDEPHVVNSIVNLFAQIINYLVRARLHCSRPKAIRAARAANKLRAIEATIERDTITLDREIRTASLTRLLGASHLAQAEYAAQEGFRTGMNHIWPSPVTLAYKKPDCQDIFRRIEASDLTTEVTSTALDLLSICRSDYNSNKKNVGRYFRWHQDT